MPETSFERGLLIFFRLAMGWTFLYAGLTQVTDPNFSVAGFLANTKTFHDVLAPFGAAGIAPVTTFLVEWGHTLIGISLIIGLATRLSAFFGIFLMAIYYMAHMDFPYVETQFNYIVDYHMVYGAVLLYVMAKHAGRVWGLDGLADRLPILAGLPGLRALVC